MLERHQSSLSNTAPPLMQSRAEYTARLAIKLDIDQYPQTWQIASVRFADTDLAEMEGGDTTDEEGE